MEYRSFSKGTWAGILGLLLTSGSVGWSATRPVTANAAVGSLQTAWNRLILEPGLRHSSVSALAYDVTTGQPLAAVDPNLRQPPGSVTKLFTTAAALAQLGPNFSYRTLVAAPKAVAEGVPGPVYLVGGGDPWLEANGAHALQTLAAAVAKRVRSATRVVGVSSLFSPPTYGLGWPYGVLGQNYGAGTTALMAERSEVFVTVKVGGPVDSAPRVQLTFNANLMIPSYFHVINLAKIGTAQSSDTIAVTRRPGTNDIVVTGSIPATSAANGPFVVSVGKPPRFAAQLFEVALQQAGVHFAGNAATAPGLPAGFVTLASYTSRNLVKYLPIQNQFSINQMAENLYRELGVHATQKGSLAAASAAMARFSASAGLSPDRVQVDGSGLSPLNEASAAEVVQLLRHVVRRPYYRVFRNALMNLNHVKSCGFLCPPQWSYVLPKGANLWIKTGNLSNQWNYAGYARAANGNLIAFAILDNGEPTSANAYHGSPVDTMMQDVALWPNVPVPASSPPDLPAVPSAYWQRRLESAIPGRSGSLVGISVENVTTRRTVWAQNASLLMPAGLLTRVVLADAALNAGPVPAKPVTVKAVGSVADGELHGNLVLNGDHDPLLSGAGLAQLAEQVRRSGIRQVDGAMQYVQPPAARWPRAIPWNDLGRAGTPPRTALMVNQDQATIQARGTRNGHSASVVVYPTQTPIDVVNQTLTSASGSAAVHIRLRLATDTYIVSGTVPAGHSVSIPVAPPDPGRYAALRFLAALKQSGVQVLHGLGATPHPVAGSPVAEHPGPSLARLIAASFQSTSTAAPAALEYALGPNWGGAMRQVLGAYPSYLVDPTGVGLSNYLTPAGVTTLLVKAWNQPGDAPLVHALTASGLWVTTDPETRDLVGYLKAPNGQEYAVTVMVSELLWNHRFGATVARLPAP